MNKNAKWILKGTTSLVALVSLNVAAWNYSVAPVARSTMRGDDNIRGASNNEEAAWGFDNFALVNMQANSEVINSTLIPRMNIRRFVIGEDLDADEYGVTLNNLWKTERLNYGLGFNYSRDSTLSTEASDTGRRNTVVDRDAITVNPTINYQYSDKLMFETGYLFNSISYLAASNGEFIDYEYQVVNLDGTYQWREDVELFASISFSYFDSGDGSSLTRSYSGRLGGTFHWDETLQFSGAIGWIDSNVKFHEAQLIFAPVIAVVEFPSHGASNGPLASASIIKKFDQSIAKLDYVRQVSPTGRGAQSNTDRITGVYTYQFNERFNAEADVIYDMSTADGANFGVGSTASSLNRDYLEFIGTLRYKLSQFWQVSSAYHHPMRKSTFSNIGSSSQGNALYLTIEYAGERMNF